LRCKFISISRKEYRNTPLFRTQFRVLIDANVVLRWMFEMFNCFLYLASGDGMIIDLEKVIIDLKKLK